MIINLRALFSSLLVLSAGVCYAQAPNITYASPQTFTTGTAITVVKPINTGGAVPVNPYGQVGTFAGTAGIAGKVDATGAAARFNAPGAITVDASGNIFVIDGSNNVIRKITPAGVVTTYAGTGGYGALNGPASQATFSNMSGIAVDASDNIFIADQGNQLIRKITPGGIVSTVAGKSGVYGFANGQDTTAIFNDPIGVSVDKTGNLYVMDINNCLVRKITPTGLVSTLAGKQGISLQTNGPDTAATFNSPRACAIDAAGNLYVTDNNELRKISTDGIVSTIAGNGYPGSADGVGTAATFNYLGAISIDALGNLYISDPGNHNIRKMTPDGIVTTIAGTAGVTGSANGIGLSAQFGGGIYAAVGTSGNVFITDGLNNTIRKLTITGYGIDKPLPTGLTFAGATGGISGTPVAFSPATDYTITGYNLSGSSSAKINVTITGTLSFPLIPAKVYGVADFSPAVSTTAAITYISSNTAVATVVSGNVHVIAAGTSTITAANGSITLSQVLTVHPAPLTLIADNKSKNVNTANPALTITYNGFVNGDSPANFTTQPVIATPAATTSPAGSYAVNVHAAVNKNYAITFIAGTLTILGGNVTTAAPALTYPSALNYNFGVPGAAVLPANAGGAVPANAYAQVTAIAGTPAQGGYADGTGAAAKFLQPNGVALDAAGNLYVADVTNDVIRKITPAGVVTTIAGKGTNQLTIFVFPAGVTVDAAGNVYLTDTFNNVIKVVTPQGVVSIFAGGGSQLDGQGTQASFSSPSAITIDKNGNLYVADQGNDLVRKITPAGLVSTIAGQQFVQGSANGQGAAATFSRLNEIAVDAGGSLYLTDGNLVRKITAGGLVSTLAGSGAFSSVDGAGAAASFQQPWGITVEPNGIVYVAGYNQVRKITPGGVVSTVIGALNASGTVAQNTVGFNFLGGLTVDPSGNLYACDIGNDFVAKITATGYTIDKTLPAGLVFDPTTGKISGTPTAVLPPTFFTVNAYNIGGVSTSIIKLSVAGSSVATLSSIGSSISPLNPLFNPATTSYTLSVPNGTATMTVKPVTTNVYATIKVNGTALTSGTTSAAIALAEGTTTAINVEVTAQDGATTKTYTITVTRGPSSIASLSNIQLSSGTLAPAFAAATTSYAAGVPNSASSITVTPTSTDANATITVNGTSVASGTSSGAIALAAGVKTAITVMVTAQNGSIIKNYTINVTRALSGVATLSGIGSSITPLTPIFNSTTTSYTLNVTHGVTSMTIKPVTTDANATIKVNGTATPSGTTFGPIAMAPGSNTISTVVTAQDGTTTKTYTLTVTRALNPGDAYAPIAIGTGISITAPAEKPSLDDDIIAVHQGVSPNGDGVNDFLVIDGILAYPDNKLTIMNRSGQLIYEAKGYDNSSKAFDGHSNKNGQMQLPGTYFYQLDYTVGGIIKHKTGFIMLKY